MKHLRAWTNRSVVQFAKGADPVKKSPQTAADTVLKAIDEGWQGPPFDPLDLAQRLGIDTVSNDDVRDAQVLGTRGKFRIEYNPNRPPHRVRYSIAHEIAHTLFPDCDKEIRHRAAVDLRGGDDWQLEALCNIAAAELLMPAGSLSHPGASSLRMAEIVRLREQFQVSIETMAIRIAQLTAEPCAMFCASRSDDANADLRIDYVIGSHSWRQSVADRPPLLPSGSVASRCTKVGFTWAGRERWHPNASELAVEAIGIPPYPGSRYPRVVGIAQLTASEPRRAGISYVVGDATEPRGDGRKLIVHVVHDATSTWGGGGFAQALARRRPAVQSYFKEWANANGLHRVFGQVRYFAIDSQTSVASMLCQRGYRSANGRPAIRYRALRACLAEVAAFAQQRLMTVHLPRIATGAAGGRWSIVEELLESTLVTAGVPVTVYDLPGKRLQQDPQPQLSFSLSTTQ